MAMFNNMVSSLIEHERITTTVPKAKEAKRITEKLITLAKKNTLHSRRLAARQVKDEKILSKLFSEYPNRFKDRNGGYTRIVKLSHRAGDCADLGVLEMIGSEHKFQPKTKKQDKAKVKQEAQPAINRKDK
jgi:large subunit ribosomal protein L17